MAEQIDEQARRCWQTSDDDSQMRCYLGMKGRVTLAELIEHFAENYPNVDPLTVRLNYATATWEEPPTAEDLAQRERWRVDKAQRLNRWERDTYEKLKAKFEAVNQPQEDTTVPVCDCSPYPNHGPNATPCNCGESCAVQRVSRQPQEDT